jgi:MFS family permease
MSRSAVRAALSPSPVVAALLPIVTVVSVAYLVIGLAMPVLPLYVHHGLGLSMFVVGLVAGAQFAATLVSRFIAGQQADEGAKRATVTGLLLATASGLVYALSLLLVRTPELSVAILFLGRALLGGAESFIVMGALSWGLALVGAANTGTVMSWIGVAMYLAYAAGAPAGTILYARYGFSAIAAATTLVPLATLLIVAPLHPVPPRPHVAFAVRKVIGAIWLPGLGLALSSIGFGAITTFIALLFTGRGWGPLWVAFTTVTIAFVVGRLLFGGVPDKLGGATVALVSILVEAAGQAMIWLGPAPVIVLLGIALTGFGYALVYPAFGVEAVRNTPSERRGLAVGAYTAFLDVALGVANPVLGLVAGAAGITIVFLVSTILVSAAALIAIRLQRAAAVAS